MVGSSYWKFFWCDLLLPLNHLFSAKNLLLFVVLFITVISGQFGALATETSSQISVTYCAECVPFQFTNAAGKADGQIIDYWKLWSKKTGVAVRFVPATWSQTLANVRDGKVDAHAGLFFSNERNTYLDYGSALTSTDTHVFFNEDIAFPETFAELKSYRIAVLSGDLAEDWLKSRLGEASVVGFKDYQSIIAALNSGEIKLFAADTQTGLYHLGRADLLTKFKHQKLKPLYTSDWFVAAQKGNQALLDIINGGMAKINAEERLKIARTWASGTRSGDPDSIIVSIDSYYPPLSSIGIDGSPQGLMVDIWREWGKVVNRKVRFKAGNWKQTLDDVRTGEADIHSGLFKSKDREKWLSFSQPIQVIKTGLFSKTDSISGNSLAALKGKRIGAIAGSYQAQFIEQNHPEISLLKVADRTEYLMSLMRDEIVAIIEEIPTMDASLAKFGLTGSISRRTHLFENKVFAGVRKDNMALLELVNTGLDLIPRERLAKIEARWITNPEDRFFKEKKGIVALTSAEKKWIAAHPIFSTAATADWPPFEWEEEGTGKHLGISADFIKLAAQKVGLQVAPEFGRWSELVEKLKVKQIDSVPGLNKTPDRDKYLFFSEPFVDYFSVIFTSEERDDINSMSDLDGKTVAVEKGYALAEVLARDFPKISLKLVDTTVQALQAVSSNNVDAFVGNQLVGTYLIKKYLITNVKTTGFYNKTPGQLRFGVRRDLPILRLLLDKGLAAITDDERAAIIKTHTGLQVEMGKRVRLTNKEREWLNEHRTVKLGVDSAWPPFEYIDEDGVYSGLAAGYIEVLSKRLNMTMAPQSAFSWSEAIKAIEAGEGIDILPAAANTPARQKFMNFTKPYLSFPLVVATRKDSPYVGGLPDLNGKKVGVVRDYYSHEILKENHPEIIPVFSDTVADGLQALENGRSDAFFDNLGVITYEQDRLGLANIKIAAPTKYKAELSMAVRKDWPELIPILNKALDTIDSKERSAIRNIWLAVRVSFGWDIKTVLLWALPIGGSAVLIILVIVVWNRKMRHEIDQRKKAQAELTIAHDKLGEAMGHIEGSINYASRIQRSVLPDEILFESLFKDYFILWEPRDVVGGDIYWANMWGNGVIMVLGDCTGHGVPGAFMTLITTGAMDRALIDTKEGNVGEFLQHIHQMVQVTLGQHGQEGESDDGMELGVCYFVPDGKSMNFASARFDLYKVENGEVTVVKPTKSGIGYRGISFDQEYTEHRIALTKAQTFYMTSDGLIDQVGGERRRMFGKKRFKELLLSVQNKAMFNQKETIHKALLEYQGDEKRRDDVAVIGFKT